MARQFSVMVLASARMTSSPKGCPRVTNLVPGRPSAGIPVLGAHLFLSFAIPRFLAKLLTARTSGRK
ncbi:MAG TPA: hypothetical protein PKY31_08070 [Spirochaetota bacterium]|nr:hypothetical protein [Spirochaetota bacterium]